MIDKGNSIDKTVVVYRLFCVYLS